MKKPKMTVAIKKPKGSTARHAPPKPRLRARHLSTIGKSAFGAIPDAGGAAFPGGGPGGPAFPPPPGGAPAAPGPMDAGAGALAGPGGGPPGM